MIALAFAALLQLKPCSVDAELQRAAAAYRRLPAKQLTQDIEVRVPGAPVHRERLEFGFRGDIVVMVMPSQFAIEVSGEHLRVKEIGSKSGFIAAHAGSDIQQSLNGVFASAGSPVVPPAVLLRRARNASERMQSFRLKVLDPFTRSSCDNDVVTLSAANGSAHFHIGEDGLVRDLEATISGIEAKVETTMTDQPSPQFEARGAAVSSMAELVGSAPLSALPDIRLRDLNGKEQTLRGQKPAIVEFFATWCAPCRSTLPRVLKFAKTRGDIDVHLVDVGEDAERIRSFLSASGIASPALIDSDGSLHRSLGGGLPLTVVIAADGSVLKTHAGFDRDIERWLRENV